MERLLAVFDAFWLFLRFWGAFGAWRAVPGAGRAPPELIKNGLKNIECFFFRGTVYIIAVIFVVADVAIAPYVVASLADLSRM